MNSESPVGRRDHPPRVRPSIASLIGTLGVILSLGLVAWEVRQNTVATRAATYDRLGEVSGQYYWEVARDAELASIFRRIFDGEPRDSFDTTEWTRFIAVVLAFLTHLENTWRQYEAGVVDESVFDGYGWQDGLLTSRAFLDWWDPEGQREFFSDDFVEFLDAHIGQLRLED